jgi:hypothetical protein
MKYLGKVDVVREDKELREPFGHHDQHRSARVFDSVARYRRRTAEN